MVYVPFLSDFTNEVSGQRQPACSPVPCPFKALTPLILSVHRYSLAPARRIDDEESTACFQSAALPAVASAHPPETTEALDTGSRLELFVDDYLVDELVGTRLVLHHPRPAEVLLRFDRPWEGAFCAYVTVIHDGDTYRMNYRAKPGAMPDGETTQRLREEFGIRSPE